MEFQHRHNVFVYESSNAVFSPLKNPDFPSVKLSAPEDTETKRYGDLKLFIQNRENHK